MLTDDEELFQGTAQEAEDEKERTGISKYAGRKSLIEEPVKGMENLGSADSWAKTGIVCFLLFIGCLILFFFSRWVRLKKIGFYLGVLFIIMVVFANIFASDQKDEMINRKHAIVFAPTVTVKSSPDASGTDLFVLHEGTNVTVKSTLGEWSEIELEDGNVGWMPSKDIEKI